MKEQEINCWIFPCDEIFTKTKANPNINLISVTESEVCPSGRPNPVGEDWLDKDCY